MAKDGTGTMILKWVFTAVFAALILAGIGWIFNKISAINVIGAGIVAAIVIAILLLVAMKMNPGKESFIELIPTLIIVTAIVGVITLIWPANPYGFVVELTILGLASALTAVIFGLAIVNKIAKDYL